MKTKSAGGFGKPVGGRKRGQATERPPLQPNAAGIDIGAREIFVCVPADRDPQPVRVFDTFTADLNRMAEWLRECGIATVAMESTGVYWIPVYDVIEKHGMQPCLVNPRHMKNVPGRRTDWHECQWIQHLHSMGLLRSAFRPDAGVCAVRALMRHRNDLGVSRVLCKRSSLWLVIDGFPDRHAVRRSEGGAVVRFFFS